MHIFKNKNLILYIILLASSFIYFLPSVFKPLNLYDEGQIVYGAFRVLNGQMPYRDFWTLYGPVQYFVIALVFKTFGISVLVARLWDIFIRSLLALMIFLSAQKLTTKRNALLSWFMSVVWLNFFGFFNYPIFPAFLTSLFSLYLFYVYLKNQKSSVYILASSLFAVLAGLFRYEYGIFIIIAEMIILIAFVFINKKVYSSIFIYLSGIFITTLPYLYVLFKNVSLVDIRYFLITYPMEIYPKVRAISFPMLNINQILTSNNLISTLNTILSIIYFFPYYIPLLVFVLSIILTMKNILNNNTKKTDASIWFRAVLTVCGILSLKYILSRADYIHLSVPILFTIILLFSLSSYISNYYLKNALNKLIYLFAILMMAYPLMNINFDSVSLKYTEHTIKRANGIALFPFAEKTISFIQSHVPEGGFIFVGSSRHDKVMYNDVMFYFLSERDNASKFDQLVPGDVNTLSSQQKIVSDIQRKKVRYIVLFSGFDNDFDEENESSISSGITYLDDYFADNFKTIEQFGLYRILVKK